MAVRQTQDGRAGHPEVSGSYPAQRVWTDLLDRADAQFFVGETVMFSTRAGCAKCACRFDERDVERGMAWIVRHRQTKEPDTDRPNLNHRATSRLYKSAGCGIFE